MIKETHSYMGALQEPTAYEPKTMGRLTLIARLARALKQIAEDIIVKIFMICGPDPNNLIVQTGSQIASACMVRTQGLFAILGRRPTDGTSEE
jgi:hypothetical protein